MENELVENLILSRNKYVLWKNGKDLFFVYFKKKRSGVLKFFYFKKY
jgi:hypothetical protein